MKTVNISMAGRDQSGVVDGVHTDRIEALIMEAQGDITDLMEKMTSARNITSAAARWQTLILPASPQSTSSITRRRPATLTFLSWNMNLLRNDLPGD